MLVWGRRVVCWCGGGGLCAGVREGRTVCMFCVLPASLRSPAGEASRCARVGSATGPLLHHSLVSSQQWSAAAPPTTHPQCMYLAAVCGVTYPYSSVVTAGTFSAVRRWRTSVQSCWTSSAPSFTSC